MAKSLAFIAPFVALACLPGTAARAGPADPGTRQPGSPAESAAASEKVLGLPAYPAVQRIQFEGSLRTNDVPMDAIVVTTPDAIDQVMEYYQKTFRERSLGGVGYRLGPKYGYLGFFDPESETMRLVTLLTTPGGGTMLVFSSMNPRGLMDKTAAIPADLPAVPGATRVATTEAREGRERQRTVNFTLEETPPGQARKRVIRALLDQGWKPLEESTGSQTVLMREQARCILYVHPETPKEGKKPGSSVTMLVTDWIP